MGSQRRTPYRAQPGTQSSRADANAESRARWVIARCRELGLRIATAESLTGGLLADALVSVPGASRVFSGGIVAYDTELKQSLLGVDGPLLATRGPVDAEVARQMARGVRAACAVSAGEAEALRHADIGVSTTGVAGPDPDTQSGQPAGVVWIGVSSAQGETAIQLSLTGDRQQIRLAAVAAALDALMGLVQSREPAIPESEARP